MNVLFLSLGEMENFNDSSVHIDIVKRFAKNHNVYLACKREKKLGKQTELVNKEGVNILYVKTGNLKNVNIIEKGISTVQLEAQFIKAIKTYFKDVKFDLVVYTTPPITFAKIVKYIKKRDGARSFLLLKDIFPQNAVDLNMMKQSGLIYKYFRQKEKLLYKMSDYIGCMSQANVDFINNNNKLDSKIDICPNSVFIKDNSVEESEKSVLRKKYGFPLNKTIFVYGGNLGKPQGIDFVLKCVKKVEELDNSFFVIIGSGSEYNKIKDFIKTNNIKNTVLLSGLPKEDYNKLMSSCDVGLVFLDYRFTIPNFPARTLSYMSAKMPVLACTDISTDVGKIIVDNDFGWWCPSNDENKFFEIVKDINRNDVAEKGKNAWDFFNKEYSVDVLYDKMIALIK